MEKASAATQKTASELLYRSTFLRSHVTGILQPPLDGEKTIRRIDVAQDLLAMQSLRARVEQEWKRAQTPPGPYDPPLRVPFELQQRLRALTSPRHFFGLSGEGIHRLPTQSLPPSPVEGRLCVSISRLR
ncbi:MAG UNVERIFIED_CONTAM: hypothetical protein LVR18_40335 [Planctomycetaceae bacterium]|jgi:hypothetical protein